jgi:hypothetical protein
VQANVKKGSTKSEFLTASPSKNKLEKKQTSLIKKPIESKTKVKGKGKAIPVTGHEGP